MNSARGYVETLLVALGTTHEVGGSRAGAPAPCAGVLWCGARLVTGATVACVRLRVDTHAITGSFVVSAAFTHTDAGCACVSCGAHVPTRPAVVVVVLDIEARFATLRTAGQVACNWADAGTR